MKRKGDVTYRALVDLSLKEDPTVRWYRGDLVEHDLLTPTRMQQLLDNGSVEEVPTENSTEPVEEPAAEPTAKAKEK